VNQRRVSHASWLSEEKGDVTSDEFIRLIKGTRAQSLIEFERAVHAEMAAVLDATRRGQTVLGGTLYSTTFPCHECTRHVIGIGIKRLVYIEPYPKSLARELHDDAIVIDVNDPPPDKVHFEPFVGVAPRRYLELFTFPDRRDPDTNVRLPAEPTDEPKTLKPPIEMPPEETLTCPECGHENPANSSFCNACGKPLKREETKDERKVTTVLSDPAIRFLEGLHVALFLNLLDEKGVRLKEEVDDG